MDQTNAIGPDGVMHSRRVDLRPVESGDVEHLRRLETSAQLAFRWRLRGSHPSPFEYPQSVRESVLCQFLTIDKSLNAPTGLVVAYEADFINGHCKIAVTRFEFERSGISVLGGVALLFEHLFKGWPFRKLYFEVPAFNLAQFVSAKNELLSEEARLTDFIYLDGKYWDMHFLSISRESWSEHRERWLRFLGTEVPM